MAATIWHKAVSKISLSATADKEIFESIVTLLIFLKNQKGNDSGSVFPLHHHLLLNDRQAYCIVDTVINFQPVHACW